MDSIVYLNQTCPFITCESSGLERQYIVAMQFKTIEEAQKYYRFLICDLLKEQGRKLPTWANG